jgi:predicted membrane-bound spermidine synthase
MPEVAYTDRYRPTGNTAAVESGTLLSLGIHLVFLVSGAAALVYQVVWQRALFAEYGIDLASVTIVVTAFMLGLGVGSLAGGVLSRAAPRSTLPLFGFFEAGIGVYAYFSLAIFGWASSRSLGAGHLATAILTFLLVLVPTTLMGATLPLLVAYGARRTGNVGKSVGSLYFVNTLGAAAGAYATARFLLGRLGLEGTVQRTAWINLGLGAVMLLLSRWDSRPER